VCVGVRGRDETETRNETMAMAMAMSMTSRRGGGVWFCLGWYGFSLGFAWG
jgi:hypothetical protein